jgi:hypothetical protein
MPETTPESLLPFIATGGGPVIVLLLIIIWSGRRSIWHWHSELVACQDRVKSESVRADDWQRIALEALGVAERVMPQIPRSSNERR